MKTRNLNLSQETLSYLDNMDKITGGTNTQTSAACGSTPTLGTSCSIAQPSSLCDLTPSQDVPCRKYIDKTCG